MTTAFGNYMPGRIDARFNHGSDFDYIVLRIRMWGAVLTATDCDDQIRLGTSVHRSAPRICCSVHMISVFCPFADFIRFVEAIAIQAQECAFEWDPEGPTGRMRWERRCPDEDGFLTVSWLGNYAGRKQAFSHRMLLDTRQAVRMLYAAFRRFVESPGYDPIRYEDLSLGEAFSLVLADATLEEFAAMLVGLDAKLAGKLIESVLDKIADRRGASCRGRQSHTINEFLRCTRDVELEPERGSWIDPEWDEWSPEQRLAHVREQVFRAGGHGWFGPNLREQRSPLVEKWLATPQSWRRHQCVPMDGDSDPPSP